MRFSQLTSAPTLESERLTLRGFTEEDLGDHAAILSDPVVMKHFGGQGFGREDSFRRLLGGIGLWQLQGTGLLAAERKADGKLVGHVGLFDYHREIVPSIEGVPELGYIFASEVHGQGLAGEACKAFLTWADRTLDADETVAIISIGNEPSMKLAQRLGYERQPDGVYRGEPTSMWRRRNPSRG
jgi:RimJ/RimL family protein N-acetyltransferase